MAIRIITTTIIEEINVKEEAPTEVAEENENDSKSFYVQKLREKLINPEDGPFLSVMQLAELIASLPDVQAKPKCIYVHLGPVLNGTRSLTQLYKRRITEAYRIKTGNKLII